MENAEGKDTAQCVRVAVNIRPLLTPELMASCTDIITVTPGQPQVQIGSHAFTFDYVFGNGGETVSGGITLAGVTEAEVKTKEEMASYLLHGSVARATASTNMNSQSRGDFAEMKRFACGDTSVLKTHYEKKVQELELEKRALQDSQAQILRQKQKSDEAAKRLHDEIHRIKTQKVQLQQKIKQESEQFRLWKASREKEVLQLKKEGRRNEYEMHKLLALNQRQKMVMQRKTEEATMATKRLKELLESRKPAREISGQSFHDSAVYYAIILLPIGIFYNNAGVGTSSGPTIQVIEHELEVTTRVHEVHSEYERQMEERAKMAKELIELKEEVQSQKERHMSGSAYTMSPGARNSRIYALENMLATSSSSLVSMASQLSEAEECERTFNGKGRWHQVRSLAVAKNTMNFLFNLASSARCQLKDQEISCREKDSEIRDLKEKVVNLGNQLELQKADWVRREKLMILATQKLSREKSTSQFSGTSDSEGHAYDFQPKGLRNSIIHNELLEDMDISESENSSNGENDNDSDWDCNGVCCSCSKQSSCKTRKCECRAAKGLCRISCGCESTRCSNRVRVSTEEENDNIQSVLVKDTITIPDDDKSHVLASQGAMLLQCALSENPNLKNDDVPKRKPLSDIANTQAKLNIPNPGQRKKWKNPVFQLVPTSQPTAEIDNSKGSIKQEDPIKQQSNDVAAVKEDASTNKGASMPLKLPRAMRLAQTSNNTLKERNSDQQHHDATIGKDSGLAAPRSPRQWKILNDKENEGA
ncbi:hypothetical protein Leryth_017578 [Lithospermum erythrorhizon]|nr:hypothetical protein Leryth_017578 [Lithospermum erythrorhizon]